MATEGRRQGRMGVCK